MAVDQSGLEPFRCEVVPYGTPSWCGQSASSLDLATVPRASTPSSPTCGRWASPPLVLDLRGVGFLDSTGLRMLLTWQAHGSNDGIVFGVIPGPPVVARALDIAGITDHLTYWSADGKGPATRDA